MFIAFGTLALTTLTVAALAVAFWRDPARRPVERRRVFQLAAVLEVGIALYTVSASRS